MVEHDAHQRGALERALHEQGYAVLTAADAPTALHLLERLPVAEQPAAILLNLQLPIMTGQQFVYEYHRLPLPHAPILTLGPPLSPAPAAARPPTGATTTGGADRQAGDRADKGAAVLPEQVAALLDSLRRVDEAEQPAR